MGSRCRVPRARNTGLVALDQSAPHQRLSTAHALSNARRFGRAFAYRGSRCRVCGPLPTRKGLTPQPTPVGSSLTAHYGVGRVPLAAQGPVSGYPGPPCSVKGSAPGKACFVPSAAFTPQTGTTPCTPGGFVQRCCRWLPWAARYTPPTPMAVFLLRCVQVPPRPPQRVQSRRWRSIAARHLREYPACAACGSTSRVRPHHVIPVSVDPSRQYDHSNLLSLCESYTHGVNCHLFFGHGGQWDTYNPNAIADAFSWRAARTIRPA